MCTLMLGHVCLLSRFANCLRFAFVISYRFVSFVDLLLRASAHIEPISQGLHIFVLKSIEKTLKLNIDKGFNQSLTLASKLALQSICFNVDTEHIRTVLSHSPDIPFCLLKRVRFSHRNFDSLSLQSVVGGFCSNLRFVLVKDFNSISYQEKFRAHFCLNEICLCKKVHEIGSYFVSIDVKVFREKK